MSNKKELSIYEKADEISKALEKLNNLSFEVLCNFLYNSSDDFIFTMYMFLLADKEVTEKYNNLLETIEYIIDTSYPI